MATLQEIQTSEANLVAAVNTLTTAVTTAVTEIQTEATEITAQTAQIAALQQQIQSGGVVSASDLDAIKTALDASVANITTQASDLQAAVPTTPGTTTTVTTPPAGGTTTPAA